MKPSGLQTDVVAPTALPDIFGQTFLLLLDVDPFHVHAAWELTPEDRAAAEQDYTETPTAFVWILRFHDEGDGSTFDLPIDPCARSWYVELWAAGKTYHAELGLRPAHGAFVPVCCSNTITTPPAEPAPEQEPQWLAVTGALEQARLVSAPEPEARSQDVAVAEQPEPAIATAPNAPAQDFPLAQPPNSELAVPAAPLPELAPPPELAAVLEEKPAAPPAPAGSSELASSFGLGGGAKAALELELNADVIVYGRAQPGQTLRVNGREVPVNADGTFQVRWTLPVAKP
jgi:hypothetical protein